MLIGDQLADFLLAAEQVAVLVPALDPSVLGSEPWNPNTWAGRGIDTKSPAGLFVSGAAVSVVLPVSEPSQVASSWSNEFGRQGDLDSQRHRGRDIHRVRRGPMLWSWFSVEGFVIVRLSLAGTSTARSEGLTWVDAMMDASEGSAFSGTSEAERAHALATEDRLWGSANPLSLLGTVLGGQEYLACTGLLAAMKGTSFSANLSGQSASIRTSLSLGKEAVSTLDALRGPGAGEGMLAQRESAGIYASIALDLQATAVALNNAECPELAQVLQDPLASVGWSPPPRAVHLAGTHFQPSALRGKLALDVALRSKRFIKKHLESIPGRSLLESSITIEGQRVKRLSIPTMSSLFYQLSAKRLVFATKKSIMKSLLTPGSGAAEGGAELVALGIWPERLPQLREVLELLVPARERRQALILFLQRLAYAQFSISLKENRLAMHAELSPRQDAPSIWLGALW